jgi:hypothetical protein
MLKNKELLEIQNSSSSVVVGLIFLADYFFDGNMYSRFPDTYQWMRFASTLLWGVIYISAGLLHLTALYTYQKELRRNILLAKSGLWIFLATCVVSADRYAASGWIYYIFAIAAVICYFRAPHPNTTNNSDVPHNTTLLPSL